MTPTTYRSGLILALLALPASAALANAKFIHIPKGQASEALPNAPASEDEASGWRGQARRLPHVLRLQSASAPVRAAPTPAPAPTAAIVECGNSGVLDRIRTSTYGGIAPRTAGFYTPADALYGGKIAFPTPAWDSRRFLATAGWSERPGLWASHLP